MIIPSLCEFHRKTLSGREDVPSDMYSKIAVNFTICLSPEGEVDDIIFNGVKNGLPNGRGGEGTVFPERIFPRRTEVNWFDVNFPEHRGRYLFGLEFSKSGLKMSDTAKKAHDAFKEETKKFFSGAENDPLIEAYLNFAESWDPEAHLDDDRLSWAGRWSERPSFDFVLTSDVGKRLEDDEILKRLWDKRCENDKSNVAGVAQCCVYGERLPIARVHDKIWGLPGGKPSGSYLVTINSNSSESYCKKQGANACVSVKAMKEYTKALNYLLATDGYHTTVERTTFVYFALAESDEERACRVLMDMSISDTEKFIECLEYDEAAAERAAMGDIRSVFEKPGKRRLPANSGKEDVWFDLSNLENVEYCVFGLVPEGSRISVRYSYRNTFGDIMKNILKYIGDFASLKIPSFVEIANELVLPIAKSRGVWPSPDIIGSLFKSMIEGRPFSYKIFASVIDRARTDINREYMFPRKGGELRMIIIKACLNRNYLSGERKMGLCLDKGNRSKAYLCGRLFAVLEKLQVDAAGPGGLCVTIADRDFPSVCSMPGAFLPRLYDFSRYHLAKLNFWLQKYYGELLDEIYDGNAEALPMTLGLPEQGEFIVGYCQQRENLMPDGRPVFKK